MRFVYFVLSITYSAFALSEAKTVHYHDQLLDVRTSMELFLAPNLSTRLIFPFILDSEDLSPSLKYSVTPDTVFKVSKSEDIEGKNVLLIQYSESPEDIQENIAANNGKYYPHLGQLFLSIGKYNLSVSLVSTLKLDNHKRNIVFDLSNSDETLLIDHKVDAIRESLNADYDTKVAGLKETAREMSMEVIAELLSERPKIHNIQTEERSDDRTISLYVGKLSVYNDYTSVEIELSNNTSQQKDLGNLFMTADSGDIEGIDTCQDFLDPKETIKCIFLTKITDLHNSKKVITKITVDNKDQVFKW